MTSAGLLCFLAISPTHEAAPLHWQRGDEFVYAGTIVEEQNRPPSRFHCTNALSVRVFVLQRGDNWTDLAVLTMMRRADDAVSTVVGSVAGPSPNKSPAPPQTRLDLLRRFDTGGLSRLLPNGLPPLLLMKDTPLGELPSVPLSTISPFEFGMLSHVPDKLGSGDAPSNSSSSRVPEHWQEQPAEFVNAELCRRLELVQHSAFWNKPQVGQQSWHRRDELWLATHDRVVRQLQRELVTRDGLNRMDATRIQVRYSLRNRARVIGRLYDRCRTDIEVAYTTARDFAALRNEHLRDDSRWLTNRLERLNQYLRDSEPGSPYREAVLAVSRRLEAARRGDALPDESPSFSDPPN